MAFKLGMAVDLFMTYYYFAHIDDLGLHSRSQLIGKGKYSALNHLDYGSNKHARDLDIDT